MTCNQLNMHPEDPNRVQKEQIRSDEKRPSKNDTNQKGDLTANIGDNTLAAIT